MLGDSVLDARTDVYSLGCVAYWMLTGERVFAAETPMKTMMQHASSPPTPPSQRTELEIPADLEAVIMSCLEKSPDDRPANADELVESLRRCSAASAWTQERAERWWAKNIPAIDNTDHN